MKTYNEYLKIIQKRESDELDKRWLAYRKTAKKAGIPDTNLLAEAFFSTNQVGRTMQEVSIEIMGMLLQDFLTDLHKELEGRK